MQKIAEKKLQKASTKNKKKDGECHDLEKTNIYERTLMVYIYSLRSMNLQGSHI